MLIQPFDKNSVLFYNFIQDSFYLFHVEIHTINPLRHIYFSVCYIKVFQLFIFFPDFINIFC